MRVLRAFWYFITGKWNSIGDALRGNKFVIASTFDASIDKKTDRINSVKSSVAKIMAREEQTKEDIQELTKKAKHLAKVKQGAGNMAQKCAKDLQAQGKSKEEILSNPEMLKHQGAFQDSSSSYEDVMADIKAKEVKLVDYKSKITDHKVKLQKWQRENRDLKDEKSDMVARAEIAKEENEINSMLAGISDDTTDKDLQATRDAVRNLEQNAKIAGELAGNDADAADDEYAAYASATEANNDFTDLLGLDDTPEEKTRGPAELPE